MKFKQGDIVTILPQDKIRLLEFPNRDSEWLLLTAETLKDIVLKTGKDYVKVERVSTNFWFKEYGCDGVAIVGYGCVPACIFTSKSQVRRT